MEILKPLCTPLGMCNSSTKYCVLLCYSNAYMSALLAQAWRHTRGGELPWLPVRDTGLRGCNVGR